MSYQIISGDIEPGVLYSVSVDSIVYNSVTVTAGSTFRGVTSIFTYTTTGSPLVTEVLELIAGGIEFETNEIDLPVFPESTVLNGFAIEYDLNNDEKIVRDITIIEGFAIEFTTILPTVAQIIRVTKRL